jgi:hypothetical protein
VPEPIDIVLAVDPVEVNILVVTLKVLALNVPDDTCISCEADKFAPNVAVIPTPLTVRRGIVEAIDIVPVPAITIVELIFALLAGFVTLPEQVIVPPLTFNDDEEPVVLRDAHTAVEVGDIVPVPELASKITASAAVGAEAPPAPPDVVDQFVVVVVSQVPAPPRQYLFAI